MSNHAIAEYIALLRQRYQVSLYSERRKIINEACLNLGWHRKSVIRALNKREQTVPRKKVRRKRKYSWQAQYHLRKLWIKMDQMCSKRMAAALPRWLKDYDATSDEVKAEISSMSPASIDRYLKKYRASWSRRMRSGTRPGSVQFKNRIPIKPLDHNVTSCGTIEADTVAHCGDRLNGVFAWSLDLTDVKTGWTECRSLWGKSGKGVVDGVKSIEESMPFSIREFCCDNGSEFLNHQLLLYFANLSPKSKNAIIQRGRPYKKNDQCHVEQKNWTHIRQLFGYQRIDQKHLIEMMNDIYSNEWSKLTNYFYPQMKLVRKTRIGAKYKREYTHPLTPYERVLLEPTVPAETKAKLKKEYESLNPFELQKSLEAKLKRFFHLLKSSQNKAAA